MIKRALLAAFLGAATIAAAGYPDEIANWRVHYEAKLKSPDGWLSVNGLFWLHEGDNLVGSDPQSDVVLPPGEQRRAGTFRLSKSKVSWQNRDLKPDDPGPPDVVRIGETSLTVINRGDRMGIRMRDPNAETRRDFTGCKWFPADPAWHIQAKWVAWPKPKKIAITNIIGITGDESSPGYAEFVIKGQVMRLEPLIDDGSLFFLFRDATSGKTTYGAGRFLDAAMPKSGAVELDFNKAYNPPCAFTAFATCPLPPKQNVLTVAIDAGEKSYGKH